MCCHRTHLSGVNVRAPAVHVGVVRENDVEGRARGGGDGLAGVPLFHDVGDLAVLADDAEAQELQRIT